MLDPGESAPCTGTGLGETNTISNLSAAQRGCRERPPPPPVPPIHPSSLSSLPLSISAPRNLIIAGPHCHDLSLHAPRKTNRSGLRQGGPRGGRGEAGVRGSRRGTLRGENNPPMMKCSVTQKETATVSRARSRRLDILLSASLFLLRLRLVAAPPPASSPGVPVVLICFL